MTTPPSGRLTANSFGLDLKRKLGCIESKTSTKRKKILENKYLLGREIGKGRSAIVALHRSENVVEVSFQIGKMVYKDPPLKKACQPRANEGEHQQRSPDIYFLIIVPHERLCQSSLLFKPNRNPKMLMLINSSHVFKKVVFGNDRKGNGGSISDVERAIPGLEIAPWLQI
ncbi:serine/threonine-protein kinase PEPKR2-like isoform X2 [Canna indica]|uniref:Serine/threonine-protein kinase PEPKR2-like isoform X2 n=1 Tax=Canna indica TaxID=4628 RepID=A0AAQ3K9K0_9LILI|nr:serine/threonine-protein kinase PEPKR2-like isoform X2 [Canna indica]